LNERKGVCVLQNARDENVRGGTRERNERDMEDRQTMKTCVVVLLYRSGEAESRRTGERAGARRTNGPGGLHADEVSWASDRTDADRSSANG
jgi:hypothetical protein